MSASAESQSKNVWVGACGSTRTLAELLDAVPEYEVKDVQRLVYIFFFAIHIASVLNCRGTVKKDMLGSSRRAWNQPKRW